MASDLETRNYEVDIAFVGAGIGGLAAALALRQVGLAVHVFERAARLEETGGGIVIREPSLDLLKKWGIGDAFTQAAVRFLSSVYGPTTKKRPHAILRGAFVLGAEGGDIPTFAPALRSPQKRRAFCNPAGIDLLTVIPPFRRAPAQLPKALPRPQTDPVP